jgi:homeodomain interacting protein kinase
MTDAEGTREETPGDPCPLGPCDRQVIDFGSASIFSEVRYVKEPYIQSRFYRAPEILLGLPFCEKVDVWSLGCVMAELHLGWPLYPGNNEYDQVRYICETQGLPKPHLLHAACKAHHFFKRNPHPDATNPWQLKSSADYLAETKVGGRRSWGGHYVGRYQQSMLAGYGGALL